MTRKLENLILYLAHKSHNDESFSVTKLNKLLFIIDFTAYGLWGKPITEAKYVHRQYGPVPHELPIIQDNMVTSRKIEIQQREHFGRLQKRVVPLANPDLSLFTPEEIQLVAQVLHDYERFNATELSNWSHRLRPWLETVDGEEIPYSPVFVLEDVPVGRDDILWGLSQLAELETE